MSEDKDDTSLLEYMYVIGFTENQYYPAARGSPTPGEQRHSSQAKGYAERWNKGTEKILSGASEDLERRRRKSVTKIHTDMLDLMYELSERRKMTSPGAKFRQELQRLDSRLSMLSPPLSENSRSSSSNSLPIIHVQQLPPIPKGKVTLPAIDPEANRYQYRSTLKRNKYPRLTFPRVNKADASQGKTHVNNISNERRTPYETNNAVDSTSPRKDMLDIMRTNTSKQTEVKAKPKPALKRRNAGLKFIENMNFYYGEYSRKSPAKYRPKLNLSYCQCSYDERAEKGRIDNVMRRYSSKTNAGPLDFTKLQRQIERSKTMVW